MSKLSEGQELTVMIFVTSRSGAVESGEGESLQTRPGHRPGPGDQPARQFARPQAHPQVSSSIISSHILTVSLIIYGWIYRPTD